MIEDMAIVHITEAELARDIGSLLDRVQSGAEIVIERDAKPVAVLRAAEPRRRKLSEIVASLAEHSTATIDPDFAEARASLDGISAATGWFELGVTRTRRVGPSGFAAT